MTGLTVAPVLPGQPDTVHLMNTVWADGGGVHDDLTSFAALSVWLSAARGQHLGPLDEPSAAELAEVRELRDSLRRLAAFVTDDPRDLAQSPVGTVEEALTVVNRAASQWPGDRLVLRDGRFRAQAPDVSSPVRDVLGRMAQEAVEFFAGPDADSLCACRAPRCLLYFVKTRARREWCSEACGNRVRAARHYQRSRTAAN